MSVEFLTSTANNPLVYCSPHARSTRISWHLWLSGQSNLSHLKCTSRDLTEENHKFNTVRIKSTSRPIFYADISKDEIDSTFIKFCGVRPTVCTAIAYTVMPTQSPLACSPAPLRLKSFASGLRGLDSSSKSKKFAHFSIMYAGIAREADCCQLAGDQFL
jgi:hypothetical protein